jgi:hypothetical protein
MLTRETIGKSLPVEVLRDGDVVRLTMTIQERPN